LTRTGSQDDAAWIRQTVDQYEGPLILYADRLLAGDRERARDVVQETFLRLCDQDQEQIQSYLAQWLFTVCRNLALNVRRKESRMTALSAEAADRRPSTQPGPQATAEARDEQNQALHLLDGLPENQQEVIRLKFQHGMTYRQIQAVTGLPVSTVGYLIHAGRETIRKQMAGASESSKA
jgi:RNA polymerase sigma factor (sigma-70 family)